MAGRVATGALHTLRRSAHEVLPEVTKPFVASGFHAFRRVDPAQLASRETWTNTGKLSTTAAAQDRTHSGSHSYYGSAFALGALGLTGITVAHADDPPPPPSVKHSVIEPPPIPSKLPVSTNPKLRPDRTEEFTHETIKRVAPEKTRVIGNPSTEKAPPTNKARTIPELRDMAPQKTPFRALIRVEGINEHSSRASKDGNGVYNAFMLVDKLKDTLKGVLADGGNYGIHVLRGANNITPSDVVLIVDCNSEDVFDSLQQDYARTVESDDADVTNETLDLSRSASPDTSERIVTAHTIELSSTPRKSKEETKTKGPKKSLPELAIPVLDLNGPTSKKQKKLLETLVGNKVVSESENVATGSGEHVNAADILEEIETELHGSAILETSRTVRFRIVTGKTKDGVETSVDSYAKTFGPVTAPNTTKVILVDHTDVVPAKTEDQHTLKETKTHYIGRGTDDMLRTIISDVYGIINFISF